MEKALATFLEGMYYRLPMMTTELQGTDRVSCFGLNYTPIISAMTGSSVPITQPPMFHVTWSHIDNDFTALVRNDFGSRGGTIWLYNFADKPAQPEIRFWRLAPGVYELSVAADVDQDGAPDGPALQAREVKVVRRMDSARFDLPPGKVCLLRVRQVRPLAPLPKHMADVAIASRDLAIATRRALVAGTPCKGVLTVHNIGSADAERIRVRIRATAKGAAPAEPFFETTLDKLACPADLSAKAATVRFTWTPKTAGTTMLQADVSCGDNAPEIYMKNNTAEISVVVK